LGRGQFGAGGEGDGWRGLVEEVGGVEVEVREGDWGDYLGGVLVVD